MNTRRFTILRMLSVFVALIVGFCACDQIQQLLLPIPVLPQMEEVNGEVSIGLVYPTTGRLAPVGLEMGSGFEFALEDINNSQFGNVKLRFITEDSRGNPEGAVEVFNKLIHRDGVSVILGPASSSATEATFPIAQQHGVVALSPISAARGLSAIGDFVFRTALTTDVLIPSGIETTHAKLSYQTAATIYDETDVFSTDSNLTVRETLATKGIEVISTETFRSGDTDFTEQLTRIKETQPDVIFVSALPPEHPKIMTQGRQVGIPISVPFIVSTWTIGTAQAAGDAAEGAITFAGWASTADTPGNHAFVQNYSAKYGTAPSHYAARSYVAVKVLAEAIANAPSADPTAIRDALANITDLDTIFGKFSFNAVGDAVYDPIVLIVQNGEFQIFE